VLFPHQDYDTNHGLTETTGPGCVHLGVENTHKFGAIGVPGFDWECRFLDGQGHDLPDEEEGELVTAIIQIKSGHRLDRRQVHEFAKGLPSYKRPRLIHFDRVPRNATGKIEKPRLRERYSKAAAEEI
jgi:acyl-coenzyme A synthetase/AMP-(fatty) acid ligase